jgi:dolichol-phosphate mannosyltransferase
MPEPYHIPSFDLHEFSPKATRYCIIVGVLNEGENFRKQIAAMQHYRNVVDIIIADGGSTDGATAPSFLQHNVRTLLIKTGKGRLSAQYRMAFHYALEQGYEGIITVDGHNKDDMSGIPLFISALDEGYDMIQGSRFMKGGYEKNTPFDRLFAIRFVHSPLISIMCGFWYTDTMNGFKAFSARYLRDARVQPFRQVFDRYNLQYYLNYRAPKIGLKVIEVPVSRVYPADGTVPSKINGLKGRLHILLELFLTVVGGYNPKR